MSESLEQRVARAVEQPQNLGELKDADAVGTAGSPGCGDMLRIWLKYREDGQGGKVIDQASFQSFGCETAMAVASVATEMLVGKTAAEARHLSGQDLAAPLGALPPMKIHCATLVEEALRQALEGGAGGTVSLATHAPAPATGLSASLQQAGQAKKIVFLPPSAPSGSNPS
ncbi:MAG: iron-sulfur cluster assembly scaffold protein [Candidatus Methylacidiphilales bacterium]|nr:iron-sulfur cluster assembly scaffold protein [Candidatus Methylacidiphilales bacterium]